MVSSPQIRARRAPQAIDRSPGGGRTGQDQAPRGVHAAGFGQIDLRINPVPAPRDGAAGLPGTRGGYF
jgi:hypothetical protein